VALSNGQSGERNDCNLDDAQPFLSPIIPLDMDLSLVKGLHQLALVSQTLLATKVIATLQLHSWSRKQAYRPMKRTQQERSRPGIAIVPARIQSQVR
jgi:hypothetical protein